MPGDAFVPKPCCDRSLVTAGHEHTMTCPTRAAAGDDQARAFARRVEQAANMVPGPEPGVTGSFLGDLRGEVAAVTAVPPPLLRMRSPRWAVLTFPTRWDETSGPDEPGVTDGRAVIPTGATVIDIAAGALGVTVVVLADCDAGPDGGPVPQAGWTRLALRVVHTPGSWAMLRSPDGGWSGSPVLLGRLDGAPVFSTSARPLSALEVDEARVDAGHEL